MGTEFTAATTKKQRRQRRHASRLSVEETRRLARTNVQFLREVVYAPPALPAEQPRLAQRTLGRALDGFKGAASRILRAFRGR